MYIRAKSKNNNVFQLFYLCLQNKKYIKQSKKVTLNLVFFYLPNHCAISIDYKNCEVNLKINTDKESEDSTKDLIQELKEENHVHPNILFYLVIIVFIIGLICASMYFVKNKNKIHPFLTYRNRRQPQQVPTETD